VNRFALQFVKNCKFVDESLWSVNCSRSVGGEKPSDV